MKCPKCGAAQPDDNRECVKCGVIFSKIKRAASKAPKADGEPTWTGALEVEPFTPASKSPAAEPASPGGNERDWEYYRFYLRELLTREADSYGPGVQYVRLALLGALAAGSLQLLSAHPIEDYPLAYRILHLVNLVFHEAGHPIFSFLGRFMGILGGTLGQLLVPLICMTAFLFHQRDPFGAAVCWWWTGESLVDIAPYINDARAQKLILITGNTGREDADMHDWFNILEMTRLLPYDQTLGHAAHFAGLALMASAIAWGAWLIRRGFSARH